VGRERRSNLVPWRYDLERRFTNNTINICCQHRRMTLTELSIMSFDLQNIPADGYESKIHIGTETTPRIRRGIPTILTGPDVADEDTAPGRPFLFRPPFTLATRSTRDVAAAGVPRIWFRRTVTAGSCSGDQVIRCCHHYRLDRLRVSYFLSRGDGIGEQYSVSRFYLFVGSIQRNG